MDQMLPQKASEAQTKVDELCRRYFPALGQADPHPGPRDFWPAFCETLLPSFFSSADPESALAAWAGGWQLARHSPRWHRVLRLLLPLCQFARATGSAECAGALDELCGRALFRPASAWPALGALHWAAAAGSSLVFTGQNISVSSTADATHFLLRIPEQSCPWQCVLLPASSNGLTVKPDAACGWMGTMDLTECRVDPQRQLAVPRAQAAAFQRLTLAAPAGSELGILDRLVHALRRTLQEKKYGPPAHFSHQLEPALQRLSLQIQAARWRMILALQSGAEIDPFASWIPLVQAVWKVAYELLAGLGPVATADRTIPFFQVTEDPERFFTWLASLPHWTRAERE